VIAIEIQRFTARNASILMSIEITIFIKMKPMIIIVIVEVAVTINVIFIKLMTSRFLFLLMRKKSFSASSDPCGQYFSIWKRKVPNLKTSEKNFWKQ
jgi:hypothetical protein